MGKKFEKIEGYQVQFIANQKMFFVATAADGRVNLSPKGMDSFRVLSPNKIAWLNLTGSGNETAAHLLENDRMTIMFCAFEGKPSILRLYGNAKIYHPRDEKWDELESLFPKIAGARQIIEMEVDLVQDSCGMSVPFYDFKEPRLELANWAEKQGETRLKDYRKSKNMTSIDGKPTNIIES